MPGTFQGTCLCGSVKYEISDPKSLGICHCTRCQRWVGSGMTVVVVDKTNFKVLDGQDLIKTYSDAGGAPRNFCSNCGSSLFDDLGEVNAVTAGGLGPDFPLEVSFHLQVGSKAQWDQIAGDAPQTQ